MTRLTDADELIDVLNSQACADWLSEQDEYTPASIVEHALETLPTVDAVPVDLINRIIEADGSEDQSNAISLLSLIDTWKYVKRKEEMAKHETD